MTRLPTDAPRHGGAGQSATLLSCRDLTVGYGPGAPVCAPVDLDLGPGEVLAVVGANGAGKSTLLRTLTGVIEPLTGTVQVLGRPVDDRSAAQRAGVAVDLGEDAFFPALTAREHLELVCFGHGVDNTVEVVRGLLTEFGLGHRAGAPPEALSSGQRRRLLLATVFARPHELLILDEPEQRLDVAMRDHLAELLAEDAAAGTGIVLVSHDPALIRACATRGLLLTEDATEHLSAQDAARALETL